MERLTYSIDEEEPKLYDFIGECRTNTEELEHNDLLTRVLQKLGQLEDIEEELGIDLITLFKALKEGIVEAQDLKYEQEYRTFPALIWTKPTDNFKYTEYEKNYEGFCLYDEHYGNYFYFVDYKKTWSLRKEDLEDEKED